MEASTKLGLQTIKGCITQLISNKNKIDGNLKEIQEAVMEIMELRKALIASKRTLTHTYFQDQAIFDGVLDKTKFAVYKRSITNNLMVRFLF